MAIKPIYEEKLKQVGCGNTQPVSVSEIVNTIKSASEAEKQTLKEELVNLLGLIEIQDLGGKPSFKAFPL